MGSGLTIHIHSLLLSKVGVDMVNFKLKGGATAIRDIFLGRGVDAKPLILFDGGAK
jgi:hypothetical protein